MGSGGLGVHSDQDVSMHSADEDDEEDVEKEDDRGLPTKPELPPPEAGTTLFIRNVPWEATEEELRQALRGFGPLRYLRIVMDHEVGRSKGTAFACYWKKEDADKVIANSEALSKETSS
ncbi:15785_t:CDS:2, partial [Acaulospora colombiana]